MKLKFALAAAIGASSLGSVAFCEGKTRVIATVPELVDIVKRVGGDHVSVEGLSRGTEDIHQVVMRPSFVPKLNRADAVVYLGLTVEHSFLPALLGVASNPKLRADVTRGCAGEGCIDCSVGVRVLEKPDSLSRAEGELHPQGNPHYNLDPENGAVIAKNIADGLSRVDPSNAARYQENQKAFVAELQAKIEEWRALVAPLKGLKAVSFHKDVPYLGRFTGLEFVDTIENKPGVAPTPTHLQALVKLMKDRSVGLIVREQQYDRKVVDWIAEKTGARVAVIGTMANSLPDTETFIKLQDRNLRAIVEAARR